MIKENHPDNNVGNIEYISKGNVIDALIHTAGVGNRILDKIKCLEPADVVQVVHAQWQKRDSGLFYCSKCGLPSMHKWPYCEQCGAKMDGKREE